MKRYAGWAVICLATLWARVAAPTSVLQPGVPASNAAAVVAAPMDIPPLACANWVYAGSKSSVCFSSKFLSVINRETNIDAEEHFTPVPLAGRHVFDYPFAVMTGEGAFTLTEQERRNMRNYLRRGGFLLASAGCSSREWARSFLTEFRQVFPEQKLHEVSMDHPLFRTYHAIASINLKKGGTTLLKGLTLSGRLVMVYCGEGLNDTSSVDGCCCCGGNEVKNSQQVNVNIFTYAVLH